MTPTHGTARFHRPTWCYWASWSPEPGAEAEYAERLTHMVGGFTATIFVHSAGQFAGRLI